MRMLRRATAVAAVAITASLVAPAVGAGPALDWTYSPTEGPPGTVITVEGTCVDDANMWEAVQLSLLLPFAELDRRIEPITPGVPWSFTLTVPADAEPFEAEVAKQCANLDAGGNFAGGEATTRQPFTITAAPAPPTTAPPVSDPGDDTPAPPPVAAAPSFTG